MPIQCGAFHCRFCFGCEGEGVLLQLGIIGYFHINDVLHAYEHRNYDLIIK